MRAWRRFSDSASIGAALVAIALAAATFPGSAARRPAFLAFLALAAIGDLFEVTLPNDVPYSLALAPALGFALLGHHSVSETVIVFAAGMLVASALRAATRRPVRIADTATHVVALVPAAWLYNVVAGMHGLPVFHTKTHGTELSVVGVTVVLMTVLVVETLLGALRAVGRDPVPLTPVLRGLLRSTAALHLSLLSVSALLALAYPSLRYWSFPLILAPLGATQYAFRQFATIRRTYLQTIRALSKVPEMAGYTHQGHSTRVAALSTAIARELGIVEQEIHEIEYAALLHDIGRLSVSDPDAVEATSTMELAVVGAAIVRETGHFPNVAEMIERQHEPYRRRGESTDRKLQPGAKIIKVSSAYDDLTRPGGIGLNAWDALDRLHAGAAYDYDPSILQALTRVLEKRGDLG